MMVEKVLIPLLQILVPVLGALLVALVGYVVAFLRQRVEKIRYEVARRVFIDALVEAEIVVNDGIMATNQKLVEDLKAKAEDGKLTSEGIKEAMRMSKEYFLTHLSSESAKILEAAFGPIQEWVEDFIEAKLGEAKGGAYGEIRGLANPLS